MILVGNLDVETTWARMDAAARRARGENAPRPDDPRFALPEPVMRKISAAATLMRVFAESDDDVLWTPRPVERSRMATVEWLPTPQLETGPTPEIADVWWGEPTEAAARLNHRSMTLRWRVLANLPMDGASLVRSVEELILAARNHGEWVAKAPFSAAGRLRVHGTGPPDDRAASQAGRLLDLYGCLLFEPWLPRSGDMGFVGAAVPTTHADAGCRVLRGPHVIEVDSRGGFRGIFMPGADDASELTWPVRNSIAKAVDAMGARGCFGVDVFTARGPSGGGAQLSEVNWRRTFGHVANALSDRMIGRVHERNPPSFSLRFGRGAPPSDTIPLLLPGPDDDTSAWLEVQELPRT